MMVHIRRAQHLGVRIRLVSSRIYWKIRTLTEFIKSTDVLHELSNAFFITYVLINCLVRNTLVLVYRRRDLHPVQIGCRLVNLMLHRWSRLM
jgi:hypothetical protein